MSKPIILLFSHLSPQIRSYIDHGQSYTVMGEIIMFTSAVKVLRQRGFNVKIIDSVDEFIEEDKRGVVHYILDYVTIDAVKTRVMISGKIHRIRLFCYWGRTSDDMPWKGPLGHTLTTNHICIPFPYPNKPNLFLGFIMPDLTNTTPSIQLNPSIHGYLWGKEEKYINTALVNGPFANAGIKFYATCTQPLRGYNNVTNLGLQPRDKYLDIIRHVKYVIGFGDPVAGPTIIECLELGKILIAPSRQIPTFLHTHPNIVLSDQLRPDDIIRIIRNIEAGHKHVSTMGVKEYREEEYTRRNELIFRDPPEKRWCIIRCDYVDNNIFHFLTFDIYAIWEFVRRNNRVQYCVIIHYDPTSASHRWRKRMIESMGCSVYGAGQPIPSEIVDYNIIDMPLNITKFIVDFRDFIKYPVDDNVCAMADRIKDHVLNVGWRGYDAEGLLLIQRRNGTRRLVLESGDAVEGALEEACKARGIPFRCCYFEDMEVDEQIRAVSRAKWIVAAHGAAMTNIIFATRGSAKLIEVGLRPHWYCDPVCDAHFNGKIPMTERCRGARTTYGKYHKADYHNLCSLFGIAHAEVEPCGYGGRFIDRNPISKELLIVRCEDIMKHVL